MTTSRRTFVFTGFATGLTTGLITGSSFGAITLLPFGARAAERAGDLFETPAGLLTVHPVAHASFVMETPKGTIYVDPVGDVAEYAGLPAPDLILVTHEHGDHFSADTLQALVQDDTQIITNPAVFGKLPGALKGLASEVANGGVAVFADMNIEAIPAYNTTEDRLKYHPPGRDNGYVLNFEGFRVYVSGDTEDIPEMRALMDIDLAFVCMNLPFTMDANAAASAVSEFAPRVVYPYHYRGRDGEMQDPEAFAKRLGTAEIEVKFGQWYD